MPRNTSGTKSLPEAKLTDETLENLLTLCLFRLGGEVIFTQSEIKKIAETIGGSTLAIDKNGRMILRARSREAMKALTITNKRKKPAANTV